LEHAGRHVHRAGDRRRPIGVDRLELIHDWPHHIARHEVAEFVVQALVPKVAIFVGDQLLQAPVLLDAELPLPHRHPPVLPPLSAAMPAAVSRSSLYNSYAAEYSMTRATSERRSSPYPARRRRWKPISIPAVIPPAVTIRPASTTRARLTRQAGAT